MEKRNTLREHTRALVKLGYIVQVRPSVYRVTIKGNKVLRYAIDPLLPQGPVVNLLEHFTDDVWKVLA